MKKCLLTFVLVLFISSFAYAIDFSIGATVVGWGPTFTRGSGKTAQSFDGLTKLEKPVSVNYAFSPVASIVGQVDIIPYFGIELGVGYAMKHIGINILFNTLKISFSQITIPLLLKAQYEIADRANIYFGIGPRFNFNLATTGTQEVLGLGKVEIDFPKDAYNTFDMDLTFALGCEFKLASSAHYLGFRVAYDMNLLGSITENTGTTADANWETEKSYIDDLAISLTYRYKFGQ